MYECWNAIIKKISSSLSCHKESWDCCQRCFSLEGIKNKKSVEKDLNFLVKVLKGWIFLMRKIILNFWGFLFSMLSLHLMSCFSSNYIIRMTSKNVNKFLSTLQWRNKGLRRPGAKSKIAPPWIKLGALYKKFCALYKKFCAPLYGIFRVFQKPKPRSPSSLLLRHWSTHTSDTKLHQFSIHF